MTAISVYDARASFSRLIDRALEGEEIVITRKGKPVVKMVPVGQEATEGGPRKRQLGMLRGLIEVPPDSVFLDPLPDDFLKELYGNPIFPEEDEGKASP